MIAIIDYDMGNLRSVQKAFEAVGHRAVITRKRQVIADASHVVLPGVGAFGDCMRNLVSYDLIDPITQSIASGKPFLGICLGLQLLFTESEEFGSHKGLNVIPGRVVRFKRTENHLRVEDSAYGMECDRRAEAIPPSGGSFGCLPHVLRSFVLCGAGS